MFKKLFSVLEAFAFWFMFFCVGCLAYSVFSLVLLGDSPSLVLYPFTFIAVTWCYFAGTIPVLYIGLKKLKNLASHEQE